MTLVYEKNGPVAMVRLNRPEAMNSIDPDSAGRAT